MTRGNENISNGLDKSGNYTSGPGYYIFTLNQTNNQKVIQSYTDGNLCKIEQQVDHKNLVI